jgi:RHS repeat-associated protein
MEADDEISGIGNNYTTEFRRYDARICRWLSVDPLFNLQPGWSPYKAFLNNPIIYVDPRGGTEEERLKALQRAREYVNKNTFFTTGITTYSQAGGGHGGPGSNVDCQGLVDGCIIYAGLPNPNTNSTKVGKVNALGVGQIVNMSTKVALGDVQAGNAITFNTGNEFGDYAHIGIITGVTEVDGKTKITFIHSGSSKGPYESSFIVGSGSYWDKKVSGYWKWDNPDPVPDFTITPIEQNTSINEPMSTYVDLGPYIMPDLIIPVAPSSTTYTISTSSQPLNMWSAAGGSNSGADFITTLAKGVSVTGTGNVSGSWTEIKTSGGQTGWVHSNYITKN